MNRIIWEAVRNIINPMTFEFTTDSSLPMPARRRIPELLAPAGNREALETVLDAGADSVYVGGKLFGMRQHAAWLNFDRDQMAEAIRTVHDRGKRIYVTLNNLLTDTEIELAASFLDFLVAEKPDALIVQDWGVVGLCLGRENLPFPLHASTMMNVHDAHTARFLGGLGFTRVVASRDITLERAVELQRQSGVEFEVFLHGDMCIAHSGQCLTSGILAGESSNRGKCLKPCRWKYDLVSLEGGQIEVLPNPHEGDYLLARKDLSLLEDIPRVASSGIAALKIEGRARKPDYLRFVVSTYRRALDDYSAFAGKQVSPEIDTEEWQTRRVRNLSTCYTFGDPGAETIDFSGEREPRFFSLAIEQVAWKPRPSPLPSETRVAGEGPEIAVHCSDLEQALAAVEAGADIVRFSRSFLLVGPDPDPLRQLADRCRLGMVLDRVLTPETWESLESLWPRLHDLGMTEVAGNTPALAPLLQHYGLRFVGDFGLNVLNPGAAEFLSGHGVGSLALSLEATLDQAVGIIRNSPLDIECVVHGPLPGMLMEHCILNAMLGDGCDPGTCLDLCGSGPYGLRDPMGQVYEIHADRDCRNFLLLPLDLCSLAAVPQLCAAGVATLRIEGSFSEPETLAWAVTCYRAAIEAAHEGRVIDWSEEDCFRQLETRSTRGFSLGSFGLSPKPVAVAGKELPTNLWLTAADLSS